MKTSHIIVLGVGVAAYLGRHKLKEFFDNTNKQVTSMMTNYAESKVSVKSYKLPKIGFDLKNRQIKLDGDLYFENKSTLSVPLTTYRIELVLEKQGKGFLVGKTPLAQPNVTLAANSKTRIGYKFRIDLKNIKPIMEARKDLVNYDAFVIVKDLSIGGYRLPNQKISITEKWRKMAGYVLDPINVIHLLDPERLSRKLLKF